MNAESKAITVAVTYEQMERMAQSLVKSKLFGLETTDQALALMAIAQAEGKHPAIIARDFHLISGRPAKKAEAMMRDFVAAGGSVKWHALDDTIADATFSHPQGGTARISWDMNRAKAAGLLSRGDMYRKYPRQMLRSRTVSEGVRTVAPLCTSGVYTPEEVQDMAVAPAAVNDPTLVEATPVPVRLSEDDINAHCAAMGESVDLDGLKRAFATAYGAAKRLGDGRALDLFERCKDACKTRLTATEATE